MSALTLKAIPLYQCLKEVEHKTKESSEVASGSSTALTSTKNYKTRLDRSYYQSYYTMVQVLVMLVCLSLFP